MPPPEASPEGKQRFAREVLEKIKREAREWVEHEDRRIAEERQAKAANCFALWKSWSELSRKPKF